MKRIALFYLNTAAAVASLVSIGVLLVTDRWHATIALGTIILFQAALLAIIYAALNEYVRARYPSGYSPISTFARYTSDGKIVRYETFKHILCRKPVMSSYTHGFKWTGSRVPTVTSALQEVGTRTDGGPGDYDRVELVFPRPLLHGEPAVVHHAMEMDDSDGASSPHVEFRVQDPVQLIAWRIELKHLPRTYRKAARLTRRRIDALSNARPEHVAHVPFNSLARSYEHHVTHPEPGYFYSLEWDR
jgi:hypothetical protein